MPWLFPTRFDAIAEADRLAKASDKGGKSDAVSARHEWRRVERGEIDAATAIRLIGEREEGNRTDLQQKAAENLKMG